jgi:N-acylneuraminate cytidylyltransferase
MVLLEPTCPFRLVKDVQQCLELLDSGYDSAATFVDAEVNPHRTWRLTGGQPSPFIDNANPWLPRQELPEAYQLNGGCYAFETTAVRSATSDNPSLLFGKAGSVQMPPERSVDIDSPVDLIVAQTMVTEGKVEHP